MTNHQSRISVLPLSPDSGAVECLLSLPQIASATAVAFACRVTARTFLEKGGTFGKAELVSWLMGPYAALTRLSSIEGPCVSVPDTPPKVLPGLDDATARRLVANARLALAETIADLRRARGGAAFSLQVFSKGFVAAFEDRQRNVGWLPTNHATTLTDRVLSLVAADYLTRPEDYRAKRSPQDWTRTSAGRQREEDQFELILPLPRPRLAFARVLEKTGV